MVILYPSYDINKLKGSVNSGSPFIGMVMIYLTTIYKYNK